METKDQAVFLELMMQIGTLYNQSMQEFLVEIYWAALKPFDLESVRQALQAHIHHPDTGQYLPKPADLLRFLQGSHKTRAHQAWSTVLKAIREVGCYESVVFDDPLIHRVVADMGGWVRLCAISGDRMPFQGHDFQARYVGYLNHAPVDYPCQLTGLFAYQNGVHSIPICIGNPVKARQVYQGGLGHNPSVFNHLLEEKK